MCSLSGARASPAPGRCPGWSALPSRAALLVVPWAPWRPRVTRDTCALVLSCSLCPHARPSWESGFSLGSSEFPSVEPPPPASRGPGEMESAGRPPGLGRRERPHSDSLSGHSDHQESPRAAAWRTRRRLALPRAQDAPRVPSRQSCQPSGTETSACRVGRWEGRPGPRPFRKPKAPSAPWKGSPPPPPPPPPGEKGHRYQERAWTHALVGTVSVIIKIFCSCRTGQSGSSSSPGGAEFTP